MIAKIVLKALLHTTLLIFLGIGVANAAITIKPFRACRANDGLIGLIACQDCNMLTLEQARKVAQTNPLSFVHVARPEVDCSEDTKPYDVAAGIKGHENLQEFLRDNLLCHDKEDSLYLYGRIKNNRLQVGIIALVDINEYKKGNIKRHEEVLPTKERKLRLYTELQRAQVDPVLLLHEKNTELSSIVETIIHQTPHQSFYVDHAAHVVWVIKEKKTIRRICDLFKSINTLYIADGHHRTAAAAAMKNEAHENESDAHNYYMAGIFPFDQVTISSFNRIFKDLNNHSEEEFLREMSQYFDMTKVSTTQNAIPQEPHEFGIYCQGAWYKATLKEGIVRSCQKAVPMLDIAVLSNLVLKPFLNIDIYHPDDRTEFVAGMWGLECLERDCKKNNWPLAIAFFPVRSETFSTLVNEGTLMPPKTTCFEPKIRPGLFTYTFDCDSPGEKKEQN